MTPNATALIAEYKHLRHEADRLDQQRELIEVRLVELERLLPEDYMFPDDLPGR